MTVYDLTALDQQIRATLTTIHAEALRLDGRRNDELTEKGLKTRWDAVVSKYAPQVEALAKDVDAAAVALDRVRGYEREHMLPSGPLTTQQELLLARILARPNVFATETIATTIAPHLETPVATELVREIQFRNGDLTDDYVDALLARSSMLYAEAINDMHLGLSILSVLKQGIEALRAALDFSNVNSLPLDHHRREGIGMPSLAEMIGTDAGFKVRDNGDTHL